MTNHEEEWRRMMNNEEWRMQTEAWWLAVASDHEVAVFVTPFRGQGLHRWGFGKIPSVEDDCCFHRLWRPLTNLLDASKMSWSQLTCLGLVCLDSSWVTVYHGMVKSKMDYAGPAWQGNTCHIGKLDVAQNRPLRIITGQFKDTPLETLRAESGVQSFKTHVERNLLISKEKASEEW